MGYNLDEQSMMNRDSAMNENGENLQNSNQKELVAWSEEKKGMQANSTMDLNTIEAIPKQTNAPHSDDEKALEEKNKFSNLEEGENLLSVERIKNSTLGFVKGEDATKEELFEELKRSILSYHPSSDLSLIEKAYKVADEAHKPKLRKSGQPYITHPLHVALILADLRMDKETIASALLHDVIEDCPGYDYDYISKEFGKEIADIVDGVTKVQKDGEVGKALATLKNDARISDHAETYRKMLLSSGKNPRVLYVKIADRLHNMRTLDHMPTEKQKAIALETINIYSSFAEKLGISKIKVELDDYSLKYLHPDMYKYIKKSVNQRLDERWQYIHQIMDRIKVILKENGIEAKVTGRVKHFYSIYKKLSKKKKTFDEIYDLFAVRVITKNVSDAYKTDGVISQEYATVSSRRKDYIAKAKPNGYRSIHETMYGPDKNFFELQVRTEEMHREANYGKAAHWVYKERGDGAIATADEIKKRVWLEQLTEAVMEENDNAAFLERAREILDINQDKIFFSSATNMMPWEMPAGSTVVDFAYAIHTAVGHRMIGAKVFNRMVSLDYVIKSSDIVEILEAKDETTAGPKREWLKHAFLNSTKAKIKSWFNKQNKEENIKRGLELLLKQCQEENTDSSILENPKYQVKAMQKLYCDSWEKVLANVGTDSIKPGKIINWLKDARKTIDPEFLETNEELMERINSQKNNSSSDKRRGHKFVSIQGFDLDSIRFPKCCCAIPGDEVIGYISRGRGMLVHRAECVNVKTLLNDDAGRIKKFVLPDDVDYAKPFRATITVLAERQIGVAANVLAKVAEKRVNASNLMAVDIENESISKMVFDVDIKNASDLAKIIEQIRGIRYVFSVERTWR